MMVVNVCALSFSLGFLQRSFLFFLVGLGFGESAGAVVVSSSIHLLFVVALKGEDAFSPCESRAALHRQLSEHVSVWNQRRAACQHFHGGARRWVCVLCVCLCAWLMSFSVSMSVSSKNICLEWTESQHELDVLIDFSFAVVYAVWEWVLNREGDTNINSLIIYLKI